MQGGFGWLLASVVGTAALALGHGAPAGGATPATGLQPPFGTNWPVYHQNLMSSGVDPVDTDLSPLEPGWSSPKLDAGSFGEPLVDDGRVVVATANDTVYSLSAQTGTILWSTHLGTPVPLSSLPCASVVAPLVGITGTPYIDVARNEIFVVAMEQKTSFTVEHRLYGLNLFDGSIELDESADPPGSQPLLQLQRSGLTASQGRIIVSYTGFNDCGRYHGWVLGIPEAGGPMRTFETATAPGDSQGGIWMGGAAPVVDPAGNIWLATANSTDTNPNRYDESNAVIELSPAFRVKQFFGDPNWLADDSGDLDLGSTNATLVNGFVFIASKAGDAYLARQRHLGGIGGQVASRALCRPARMGGSAWGGTAVDGSVLYVNCDDGEPGNAHFSHITAVRVTKRRPYLHVLWRSTTVRTAGPPIVAGGMVWTILLNGHEVVGLSQASGRPEVEEPLGVVANHFPTPTVADGLLLVPSGNSVLAFVGPSGLPPAPPPAP